MDWWIVQHSDGPRGGLPRAAWCGILEFPPPFRKVKLSGAKANLLDALKLVRECQRELVEKVR